MHPDQEDAGDQDWTQLVNDDYTAFKHQDSFEWPFDITDKKVSYIVRSYVNTGANGNYEIVQDEFTIDFADAIVTGITDVAADATVRVYSLDGRLVYSGSASGMQLPRGTWIVTTNGKARKMLVK